MLLSMPGFLPAFQAARAQRPDLPRAAFIRAACTARAGFARMRVSPAFIVRWAEFHALTMPRAYPPRAATTQGAR